ncbi:MAG: MFS transporter [Stellaceae bacterium]
MVAARIDVAEIIDRRKITGFQLRTLLLCMAVLLMDGYDTQAIGYVAPALVGAWHLERASLGPVFAFGLIGLGIGGLVFGPLADRFGRKRFILASTALFGVFSLATAFAPSRESLLVLRFLTGLGLGGAMPNAVALGVEYFPRRMRASAVTFVFVGFTVGAALGGFLASALLPRYGWPSVFFVGGAVPLLLLPALAALLPESARLLILQRRPAGEIARYVARIDPSLSLDDDTVFVSSEEAARGVPLRHLFTGGRAMATLLLWVIFFLSLLVTFLLASWMPLVFNGAGLAVDRAVAATAMWQVGAIAGTLSIGQLMDRIDRYYVLGAGYIAGGITVTALSAISSSMAFGLVLLVIFLVGWVQGLGGVQGANALAGAYYPTFIRSSGVGWALGIGRIGSIVGSLLGGLLLTLHWNLQGIFFIAAGCGFLSAACVFWMRRWRRSGESGGAA